MRAEFLQFNELKPQKVLVKNHQQLGITSQEVNYIFIKSANPREHRAYSNLSGE